MAAAGVVVGAVQAVQVWRPAALGRAVAVESSRLPRGAARAAETSPVSTQATAVRTRCVEDLKWRPRAWCGARSWLDQSLDRSFQCPDQSLARSLDRPLDQSSDQSP